MKDVLVSIFNLEKEIKDYFKVTANSKVKVSKNDNGSLVISKYSISEAIIDAIQEGKGDVQKTIGKIKWILADYHIECFNVIKDKDIYIVSRLTNKKNINIQTFPVYNENDEYFI